MLDCEITHILLTVVLTSTCHQHFHPMQLHLCYLVNKANLVHNLFLIYICSYNLYQSLHVSGDYVPIIRRNNCVYEMFCTCYSVWLAVWCAPCIPDNHPHRITGTQYLINTVVSPEYRHIVARNM